ncbi:CXXC-type zinc finger protein 1 [Drosophila guanche]|uniref:CXXC-type zinc finger protein 1 n=1 Tax=Drosophila guanche TaxID=7266 RepID=A0A3B0JZI2_DROGU|nr:CXXC-type zinc finger protein 1 [Drosophila guanche]SPP78141.1 blast:Maestro heat-like repeat-containing protein family member 1 [Drosophila guanche]
MSEKKDKKYKKSREEIRREIAREFDLPERKSKIATILKQEDQAYCICRTSDCSRFMIGCDGCEEWYHGDCIGITEKEAKHIKQYFCCRCKQDNPELQTIFRLVATERAAASNAASTSGSHTHGSGPPALPAAPPVASHPKRKHSNAKEPKAGKRCGTCEGCRRPNCNQCNACRIRVGHKPRCIYRTCVAQAAAVSEPQASGPSRKREKASAKARKTKVGNRVASPEVFLNPELEGTRQCHGPGCCCQARPQSKYCSDKCGFNLATSRIFQVLPQRLQEWNLTPCRAAEDNRTQLETIRDKQSMVRFALAELEKRSDELNMVVERAKHSVIEKQTANDNGDVEDEQSMYCITCGHEIHSRTAIKHMEKCFNKYESQASFGSIFQTRMEGNNMFCDFYNPASKTYCKRLRVLCPEHSKDPKVNDTDVCGAPLVVNVFDPTGQFCRAPKKSCFKHYAWEKIRRAEIDLERVRQWLKMDDLMEHERGYRQQLSSRANLLGLMLHSTYNHEVIDELVRKQNEQLAEFEKQQQRRQQQHHQKEKHHKHQEHQAQTQTQPKQLPAQSQNPQRQPLQQQQRQQQQQQQQLQTDQRAKAATIYQHGRC